MQVKDIMQALEKLAPQQLKEDWDNVGLQLGDPNAEVRRVLLALTPSLAVTEEAVRREADLIVSRAFMPWKEMLSFVRGHLTDRGCIVFLTREELEADESLPWTPAAVMKYTAADSTRYFCAFRERM